MSIERKQGKQVSFYAHGILFDITPLMVEREGRCERLEPARSFISRPTKT